MQSKPPSASEVQMTELVLPQHTNAMGSIFGGVVMSWVDIAAATCAMRHSAKAVVTASVDTLHFLAPIRLGWIVSLKAVVTHVFNTSCEIAVKVTSENPLTGESYSNAEAFLTFVALNSHGHPTLITPLELKTEAEKKLSLSAIQRRASRLLLKETLLKI